MPIYNPADYPAIIARLKAKLAEKGVVMGPTLSEAYITAFETACNTRLPEAYRLFLQQVGDGCQDIRQPSGISIYGLKRLADTEVKDLSRSVTIDDYWLWEEEEDEALLTNKAFEERLGNEGVLLLDQGCGDTYQLITSGKWAGEVWNFCDVGAGPCCERQDFLGWLELWVDSDFDADFFKDYVYPGDTAQ